MPIAATGPRLWFEFRLLNSRHSTPGMTVAAEAVIGAMVPCHAARSAL